ncbi:MAG: 4Fe-4S dicluster domain-containing protein [Lentimicrobiaceae bacterium]|nr:4Fe-4S dicluster domain-containing protein [Lentimicrobiaceae bacterium]
MIDFGYQINKGRTINLDVDRAPLKELEKVVPSFQSCIRCGSCTATCSAAQFTDFNIRKIHTKFSAGLHDELAEMLKPCMLCGKCTLVCPRGVNLRALVVNLRKILKEKEL